MRDVSNEKSNARNGSKNDKRATPLIGGPTPLLYLPRPIESFLSWQLCLSCLTISGYHYMKETFVIPFLTKLRNKYGAKRLYPDRTEGSLSTFQLITNGTSKEKYSNEQVHQQQDFLNFWIPLTTHSRAELERATPMERYLQLVKISNIFLDSQNNGISGCEDNSSLAERLSSNDDIDDAILLELFRSNTICRRLASLAMRPYLISNENENLSLATRKTMLLLEHPEFSLVQRLAKLWPQLLNLPPFYLRLSFTEPDQQKMTSLPNEEMKSFMIGTRMERYGISVIIPVFNENGTHLEKKLQSALDRCDNPWHVELIVVDAGGSTSDLPGVLQKLKKKAEDWTHKQKDAACNAPKLWGNVQHLLFSGGGGRGPCLNYGASVAHGCILTFCHADTSLPSEWDVKIKIALGKEQDKFQANSCAFSFGIDTSTKGLSNGSPEGYYPPGIKAVETTANLRAHLYSLPYGDQVISLPTIVFEFLGGFPDQCLMEDYELVALLRKRASLLNKVSSNCKKEYLQIIPGEPALCSPRRWQKFGVLHVTFMNSKLVNMYVGGVEPNELFCRYYKSNPPKRQSELSPWEIELESKLSISSVNE